MQPRWQLTDGHDLRLRFWGEACVVHHRASNQTHRLSAGAGQLLELLQLHGAQTADQLAEAFEDLAGDEVDAVLGELQPLLLVERRP